MIAEKIALTACLLAALWSGLRWFEGSNLYHPDTIMHQTPAAHGLAHEEWEVYSGDGEKLGVWFIDAAAPFSGGTARKVEPLPPGRSGPPILVYFHGNAGNISTRLEKLAMFRSIGVSTLVFDYRGFGKSTGRPSEEGTYSDAEAVVEELLIRRGLQTREVFYYGESLGCAVALETALRFPPRALILDSGFTSTTDMGKVVFPVLPVEWMIRYRYDNAEKIGKLEAPLFIMHSRGDDVIPYAQGERLFNLAREPKSFLEITGDHNTGYAVSPNYLPGIRDFLGRHWP